MPNLMEKKTRTHDSTRDGSVSMRTMAERSSHAVDVNVILTTPSANLQQENFIETVKQAEFSRAEIISAVGAFATIGLALFAVEAASPLLMGAAAVTGLASGATKVAESHQKAIKLRKLSKRLAQKKLSSRK